MFRHLVAAAAALSLLALGPVGCATAHMKFPSRDEVQKLADAPVPPVVVDASLAVPADWTLSGPFPESFDAPHPQTSAFERALVQRLQTSAPSVRLSGNLACAAREAGAYLLERKSSPPHTLLDHMAGRCNVGSNVWTSTLEGEFPDDRTDDALLTAWSKDLDGLVKAAAESHADVVGVWGGRKNGHVALVVAMAERPSEITELSPVAGTPGAFTVRGRLLRENAEKIGGAINRGAWSWARCVADPSVLPPQFSLTCAGAPEDGLAWLELGSWKKDRIIGDNAGELLVSPSGKPDPSFHFSSYDVPVDPSAPPARQFTTLLNAIRERATLPPVELDEAQSATASRVAPHYFEAELKTHDDEVMDVVARGLMAGWDVQGGLVQRGTFTAGVLSGSPKMSDVVTSMLLSPFGRAAVLEPKARRLALGTVASGNGNALGVVASTYLMVEERPMQENAARVISALNRARAAKGLEPATWVAAPPKSAEEAVRLARDEHDPEAGTESLMDAVIQITRASQSGWTIQTWDLEDIQFPPAVVMTPQLSVVLAVTPYRDPHDPWGSYVIMMVLPQAANVKPLETASAR